MDVCVILTVQANHNGQLTSRTFNDVVSVSEDVTRQAVLVSAMRAMPQQFQGGVVLFFHAEPNQMAVAS